MQVHRQNVKRNQAEGLALSKDRSPAEKFDFDKTLALLALKMLMFMPNKDVILLPHCNLPEIPELLVSIKKNYFWYKFRCRVEVKVCLCL